MELWTVSKILDWTTDYFKKQQLEWPHLEAEILLAHALKLKRIELYTKHEKVLSQAELAKYKSLIKRRSQHEPIAYITGTQPFMSLEFFVDRSVLIPRPETEQLVEVTIDIIKNSRRSDSQSDRGTKSPAYADYLIADIGTGSGVIAITLAKYLPNINVIGIDSSAKSIKIAQKNAKYHKVEKRCQFIIGSMFEPLYGGLKTSATSEIEQEENVAAIFRSPKRFDLIISNPPYIPTKEIETLEPNVKDWEPRAALDGGADGLDYIRKLIEEGPKYLNNNGYLIFEFGFGQANEIRELAKNKFSNTEIKLDDFGKERFFLGQPAASGNKGS